MNNIRAEIALMVYELKGQEKTLIYRLEIGEHSGDMMTIEATTSMTT